MVMSPRTLALLGTATVGLLVAAACGTETGNPEGTVELQYNARSSSPFVTLTASAGSLSVDAVWLRLAPIALEPCSTDEPVMVDALGLTDHSGADAAVQLVKVPDVDYCGITASMEVGPADAGAPVVTAGASIALTGTLADGRRFEVVVPTEQTFDMVLLDEPLPAAGSWLLSFDVGTWLDRAELDALPGDPVVVDGATNAGALAALTGRLADGIALYLDEDGSGTVDADEPRLSTVE